MTGRVRSGVKARPISLPLHGADFFARFFKFLTCASSARKKMRRSLLLAVCVGLLLHQSNAVYMDKLADNKLCGDASCSYAISMATALDDFIAPDCRFINIKRGQMVYVYSKLVPEEGAGVFWSGSVYSERYTHQMGVIGYFPATVVNETRIFSKDLVKIPTADMDFYCD
ncbi:otoraplin-like [Synchiropus splendidus]|uniref:otoraplin-like n=1 Tax=Synchiropus splendidus TaxID=270530 RepID=UPI00237E2BC0|nr:otoraplin-like [Synchiropus splendidus]XP_053731009.1 otoraplin-like [Synchiropus splendidus]